MLDVETTGGSPVTDRLTEVAAARFRGGRCLGTYQSLVDPRCAIPPLVTLLTGITDDMVRDAPPASAVLPSFVEFVGDGVVVGHNVGFDIGFLDASLDALGRAEIANVTVDTLALARRLVRDNVRNCRLSTLARTLRLDHLPAHRALADVLATADLLHRLIEAATGYGVLDLEALVNLPGRLAPVPLQGTGAGATAS